MSEEEKISHTIDNAIELNYAYMPFILNGGIFIKRNILIPLNNIIKIDLTLKWIDETLPIEGKVIWITPLHALHHAVPGIGVQFIGSQATVHQRQIELLLDPSNEIGVYTSLRSGSIKIL